MAVVLTADVTLSDEHEGSVGASVRVFVPKVK